MLIGDFRKEAKTVTQIYYGISPFREFQTDEKSQVLKDLSISAKIRIIASVGQLIESKDRATLIHAIGILKRKGAIDNVIFAVLGEGEQKSMLEEIVKNEDVQDHAIFLHRYV